MPIKIQNIKQLKRLENQELGVSNWIKIDQVKLDKFAEVTGDRYWLHNDPERAAKESPFDGKTIAQGFLLLSHLTQFAMQLVPISPDIAYLLNYGLNRVRFISPVKVGTRIRNRMVLTEVHEKEKGQYLIITENTIEVEGSDRPAVIAEWLGMAIKS